MAHLGRVSFRAPRITGSISHQGIYRGQPMFLSSFPFPSSRSQIMKNRSSGEDFFLKVQVYYILNVLYFHGEQNEEHDFQW